MVDVVGPEHRAREALEDVVLLVGGAVRADDGDRIAAVLGDNLLQALGSQAESFFPGRRFLAPVAANQWRRQSLFAVHKVPSKAALHAQELTVDAGMVAVVGANDLVIADGKRRLAAVAAVAADGARVGELPGPRLITVRPAGKRAHRADVDAHAALFALELVAPVGDDFAVRGAEPNAVGVHVHALVADADAAVAKNAARPVVVDEVREFLLLVVQLALHEARLRSAVAEDHVLELALAPLVADGTVERVVGQQELEHRLAGVSDLIVFGVDHHPVAGYRRAGGLQLGHFLNRDQAHAARALQGQSRVVAKRRDFDPRLLRGLDKQSPGGNGVGIAVDGQCHCCGRNSSHGFNSRGSGFGVRGPWERFGSPVSCDGGSRRFLPNFQLLIVLHLESAKVAGRPPPRIPNPEPRFYPTATAFLSYGQAPSFRCSSNSLRNFFKMLIAGSAAASPSGQSVLPRILKDTSSAVSGSSAIPSPSWKRVSMIGRAHV